MFKEIEIESTLELPYKLIDIQDDNEQFILYFKSFDKNQTDYSIKTKGITGKFEIKYECCGIDSQFEIDITIGNLYYFYIELENSYECLPGSEPIAVLNNYGETLNQTNMTFRFDKLGHFIVSGYFKNKNNMYKSGIIFDIEVDTVFIYDILRSLKRFFDELRRIQGHSNFF